MYTGNLKNAPPELTSKFRRKNKKFKFVIAVRRGLDRGMSLENVLQELAGQNNDLA